MDSPGLCLVLIALVVALYLNQSWSSSKESMRVLSTDEISKITSDHSNNVSGYRSNLKEVKKSDPVVNQAALDGYFQNPSIDLNVPKRSEVLANPQDFEVASQDQAAVRYYGKQVQESNEASKTFNVKDFLPKEVHSEWFETDLSNVPEVDQTNLIDVSKFCQGVDTVGQSLKNPSYDIRGNIPNPKVAVSPFLNSSYDPDTNIKSWCN